VRVTASAPTRVDLAGGTIDIWPLYLLHPGAQTINAALTLRASVTLTPRADAMVVLASEDLALATPPLAYDDLPHDRTLPLLARLTHAFGARGITVATRSDAPAGAGIAGSSALNIAAAAALARWTGRPLDDDGLLEVAKNVEAQVILVPTGLQDYRPALYGGIAALELGPFGAVRVGLPVPAADLSARLVLCYTGAPRQSGINNWDVTRRRIDGDPAVREAFDGIVRAAVDLRAGLERGDWPGVGASLAAEWVARKLLAPGVTTPEIDSLIETAIAHGAWGGKVCGAGGGGCVFALAPPACVPAIRDAWARAGAGVLDATIDARGLDVEVA
jgi:D-glycero-alpha-D-manno-heptose-7-phosphate kinase